MSEKLESKEITSLSDYPKNRTNPFIEQAIHDIKITKKTQFLNTKNKSEISMIVSDAGEVQGYSQFLRFIEVDEEKFAKVYLSQFESFWELPKAAIKVFGYIISNVKPNQDKVEFLLNECMEYTKYKSHQPIYTGLTALINNGIVARGYTEYVYFLNPLVVFNGDRVTFAKTYIKKKKVSNPNALELPFGEAIDPQKTKDISFKQRSLLDQIQEEEDRKKNLNPGENEPT